MNYIKKSDYITAGIDENILEFVAIDQSGYIRHPLYEVIGNAEDGNTIYSLLNENVEDMDAWISEKENADHIWQDIII